MTAFKWNVLVVLGLLLGFGQVSAAGAWAPDDVCPKWGTDSIKTIQEISLYREFFKQDNYKDAIGHWKYVFFNAPGARQTTHVDGLKMYGDIIEATKDEALKEKRIDTLMMIYDKRMECFGESGDVVGRKAIDMLKYRPDSIEEIYKLFSKSAELDGKNMAHYLLYYYIYSAVKAEKKELINAEELLGIYSNVLDVIAANEKGPDGSKYVAYRDKIDEAMSPYLNCESLKPLLQKQYDAKPDDTEVLEKIFKQLKAARCATDPLMVMVTEKLMAVNPDEEKARIMALNMSNSGNYGKAMEFFKKALELTEETDKKAEYNMSIAELYQREGDFVSARSYAQKAASFKGGWGEPYIMIGDLYRGSGKKCGPGTGFESQVVVWAAVDMYQKAKSVDPSVAAKVDRKIADSKQYMPSKSECFFRNLNEGDTYTVECWINETTTVRFGPEQ